MYLPMREAAQQGGDPLADAGLAGVDLLTAADEADDDRPICVPIHARDQELGFGLVEIWLVLLAPHEETGWRAVPGTLCFIKQGHVIDRRLAGITQTISDQLLHRGKRARRLR